jgi:hypothetical protein
LHRFARVRHKRIDSLAALGAFAMLALACGGSPGEQPDASSPSGGDDASAGPEARGTDGAAADVAAGEASANDASTKDASATDAGASDAGAIDAGDSAASDAGLPLPSPLYGVTVDDISKLSDIVTSLGALPHRATTRIVFDSGEAPAYYAQAVPAVHAVSYVLGEILDSSAVSQVSPAQYAQRTSDYLAAFPTGVDVWEVGNEINGNWLGTDADVASKMTQAFDLVKAAGQHTELTLYGCSDSGATYDMFTWVNAHVPPRMLTGLDYVLVSYYEGDCGAPRSDWPTVFQQLRALFPTAGLGFGEVGYVDTNGNDLALQNESAAATYLQKYYGMQITVPGYVGGYFWWYFAEDMVPDTQPLFGVLSTAIH